MQSFRSELEDLGNPVVQKDILDLEAKIRLYREGRIDDDRFRSLRLARGVYGQRQPGVQMVRIKLPFGRLSAHQLLTIADIAEEYGSGNLHATTRQDIQIHYVSLDRTPELWARLERDDVTLREACGNTVRNITASPLAGVDPDEPFDVSPYADALFRYFLRNPVCQELGRKFKIAFSSSDADSAFAFIHDIGFIPKIRSAEGNGVRGFRVMIGGGLGSNPRLALPAYEFLEEQFILPYAEALLRVFDRYGERRNRQKARMKFLLDDLGLEEMRRLVQEEWTGLPVKEFRVNRETLPSAVPPAHVASPPAGGVPRTGYADWRATNVVPQKQKGYAGVYVRVPLGNLDVRRARLLAGIARVYAADDIRVTANQGYFLRFVLPEHLPALHAALDGISLANPGFDSALDITACPGTDTCNLGIADSTHIALEFERVLSQEYAGMIYDNNIKIKISGCPNSCGQHGLASIGFHGSSFRVGDRSLPALQVVLGGARRGNGEGILSEKVIKIPSRRGPDCLRILLDDFHGHQVEGEYFEEYFRRQGKPYFASLLRGVADLSELRPDEFVDWGHEEAFALKTETGECAGVIIDLVATLLEETGEKLRRAVDALGERRFADGIYNGYNVFVNGAKSLLLTRQVIATTQSGVLREFESHFGAGTAGRYPGGFAEFVLRINKSGPTEEFARRYVQDAADFLATVNELNAARNENAATALS